MPLAASDYFIEMGVITAHAENSVSNQTNALDPAFISFKNVVQRIDICMRINFFVGRVGQAYRIDNSVMIQCIADD
jgi:hypothetical protein